MNNSKEFYCHKRQVMNDAIDRIVIELHNRKKADNTKAILLTGCGSKSGTTTLSINLAIALSLSGWKTLLVDCDLRKAAKFKRLHENIEMGLSDYLSTDAEKEKTIRKTNFEFLDYIPGGTVTGNQVSLLCSAKMEDFMSEIKGDYDYIIFDFPSLNIVSDASIYFSYVDGIILVTALKQTTKRQIKDARNKVEKYQSKYIGLIINEVEIAEYKKYIKDYDYFDEARVKKRYAAEVKKKKKVKKDKGDYYESIEIPAN